MATIEIRRSHSLGLDTAKQKAEHLANGMRDKLGVEWHWQGDEIRFEASSGVAKGAKGRVGVSATSIAVDIDLPLVLRALKGTIEGKVNARIDAALAG
jgi:putative polyhydroxyalkanoate system protein